MLVGYIVFVIAASLTVIFSGLIREHSALVVSGTRTRVAGKDGLATGPAAPFGVGLLMRRHGSGPWWLKLPAWCSQLS